MCKACCGLVMGLGPPCCFTYLPDSYPKEWAGVIRALSSIRIGSLGLALPSWKEPSKLNHLPPIPRRGN